MESHSANVRRLVDEFRGRSGDSRVDVGGMRRVWENLLRQVEADAVSHLDLAAVLQQQLSRPTLEASFHRKLQSRKVRRGSGVAHNREDGEPQRKACEREVATKSRWRFLAAKFSCYVRERKRAGRVRDDLICFSKNSTGQLNQRSSAIPPVSTFKI